MGLWHSTLFALLPIPSLEPDSYRKTLIGLRPVRETGIRIEHERMNNKEVFHQYGHGGSGVTLSWGSAKYTLQLLKDHQLPRQAQTQPIGILGAGVIGLTTAIELLDNGYPVTLYTKDEPSQTTAAAAVAFIKIYALPHEEKDIERDKWIESLSLKTFHELLDSYSPRFPGIETKSMYAFKCGSAAFRGKGTVPGIKPPSGCSVNRKDFIMLDTHAYLQALFEAVRAHPKATIVHHPIDSLVDLKAIPEPVIINCTGFGAKKLFNDTNMHALKGQVLEFENLQQIRYMIGVKYEDNSGFVMVPWQDRLLLGPTESESDTLDIDYETQNELWKAAQSFLAKLRVINELD